MFLLLVPIALVLVVLSVLGLAGLGPLEAGRRAERDGVLGVIGPAIGLLAGIGLLVLAAIATVGFVGIDAGGSADTDRDRRADPAAAVVATATSTPPTTVASRPVARPVARLGPSVTVEADRDESFPESYDVADGLEQDTVLQVTARGFEPFGRAVAVQCGRVTTATLCFNPLPVQLDEDGAARFQYLVAADFVNGRRPRGRCRADAPPCTVVVRAVDGGDRAEIQTIFGDEIPPPGVITVDPATELSLEGTRVSVQVRDYPPGAHVTAMLCAAPDASGPRCGAPGPAAAIVVGPDGRGSADLLIEPGPVGTQSVGCSRGDECGISVASDTVFARAPVVPITFAAPPGASYDPTRLVLGLVIAGLLIAIAAWLILRTDWSPVGEAAAPEIDDAEYADLDAIIAALPPEEGDELVSTH